MPQNNPKNLPQNAGRELGKSGTRINSGYISAEEYNRRLTGTNAIVMYDTMRRSDSTIRAALQVVKLPLQSAEWDIKAAVNAKGEVEAEDQRKADFIRREMFDRAVNWDRFLRESLTMLDFGYSVFEKVWEPVTYEGVQLIGIRKLAYRKQITIQQWTTGKEEGDGVTQQLDEGTILIPRAKLAVFTHDQEGDNYEGISLLRYVYKDWDIKDKLTLINAIKHEKQAIGVPIAKENQQGTASEADWEEVADTLRNLRANEEGYIKSPKSIDIEMLDMRTNTTTDVIPTLVYHDGRIMAGVLARFMELGGASGTGSNGLSSDLSSLFMKSEEALAKLIVSTVTEDIIQQLCDMNFSEMPNGYPKLSFGQLSDDDPTAIATTLGTLAEKGLLTPDLDIETHLRKTNRLPAMSKETREAYEAGKDAALEGMKSLAGGELPADDEKTTKPNGNAATGTKNDDKTLKEEEKPTKVNPDKVKAAVEAATESRGKLLDVLLG
ncbi:MAG TPA: DUF935 family protein [Fibrella sp.]|jgi:hypothetical protein